jgi:hypothetical protein
VSAARFMAEGVEGLTRDKTRKPGTGTVQRVVDPALGPLPGEATHWTDRMLVKAAGETCARCTHWFYCDADRDCASRPGSSNS